MTAQTTLAASPAADRELVAARVLLQRMGVDPADLMQDPTDRACRRGGLSCSASLVSPVRQPHEIFVCSRMVIGCVRTHTADDVGADGRGLVGASPPLQFLDHVLDRERFPTGPGTNSGKRSENLLTRSHVLILPQTRAGWMSHLSSSFTARRVLLNTR